MLRFKILASAVPLILAGVFARSELLPGPRPCIEAGGMSVQLATTPWHADLHVGFTDDPAAATVRVQIVDNVESADFVVVDDADSAEAGACEAGAALHVKRIVDEGVIIAVNDAVIVEVAVEPAAEGIG